jgi:hypothetical protein
MERRNTEVFYFHEVTCCQDYATLLSNGWNHTVRGKQKYSETNHSLCHFGLYISHNTDLVSNPGLCGVWSASNRLSHGRLTWITDTQFVPSGKNTPWRKSMQDHYDIIVDGTNIIQYPFYHFVLDCLWNVIAHAQKPDFVFPRNGPSPFKSARASVQSTAGSRVVRISGSSTGYIMFQGSVKSTGYPLHSPVSPSLPLPCPTVCHHISTGL